MNIAHCSLKEIQKLTPDANVAVISIHYSNKPTGGNRCGWKAHINLEVDVLNPEGQSGSFRPMDEQATKIAEILYEFMKDKEDVIVQCEYGEVRSVAIARALAYVKGQELKEVQNGKYIKSTKRGESTFQGRTSGGIVRYFRQKGRSENVPRRPAFPSSDGSSS